MWIPLPFLLGEVLDSHTEITTFRSLHAQYFMRPHDIYGILLFIQALGEVWEMTDIIMENWERTGKAGDRRERQITTISGFTLNHYLNRHILYT